MAQSVFEGHAGALRKPHYCETIGVQASFFTGFHNGRFALLDGFRKKGFVGFDGIPEAVGIPASHVASGYDPADSVQVSQPGGQVYFALGADASAVEQDACEGRGSTGLADLLKKRGNLHSFIISDCLLQ
jgi:hypothetical protein